MTTNVVGDASIVIGPDFTRFQTQLNAGVDTALTRVTGSVDRASKSMQTSFKKVGDSVQTSLVEPVRTGTNKMQALLGGAIGGFAAVGLAKLKTFATGAVDAYAAVQDATDAAAVTFKEQTAQITAFADNAAKGYGISKKEALGASNTFGTFGKAAGLTGTDLSGFATKLTSLSGDLASFKGTTTEQAITAVGAALRGETEPIRAYGVLLNQSSIQAEALAIGLLKPVKNTQAIADAQTRAMLAQTKYNDAVKKSGADSQAAVSAQLSLSSAQNALDKAVKGTVPQLTQQQQVLASQSLIFKQTKDAQGDYQRTSTSTANVQKTLQAETANASAKLGQQLAPAVTAVRLVMLRLIQSGTQLFGVINTITQFVQSNKTTFEALAAVITAVMLPSLTLMIAGWVRTGIEATISAVKQAAAWVTTGIAAGISAAVQIGAFAVMVAGWVRTAVQATASAIRIAAAWLISIGPIALVIAAVAGLVFLIIRYWSQIKNAITTAANAVLNFLRRNWPLILTIITGPFGLMVAIIIRHWDAITSFIGGIPGKIKDIFSGAIGWLSGIGHDIVTGLLNGITNAAGNLMSTIKDKLVDAPMNLIKGAWKIFSPSKITVEYGKFITDGFTAGIKLRGPVLLQAQQELMDKLKAKVDEAKQMAQSIKDTFTFDLSPTQTDTGGAIAAPVYGWQTGPVAAASTAAATSNKQISLSIVDRLKAQADQAEAFDKVIGQLRKAKLRDDVVDQLVAAGPSSLASAQEILSNVSGVNKQTGRINAAGKDLATRETALATNINVAAPKVTVHVTLDGKEIKALAKAEIEQDKRKTKSRVKAGSTAGVSSVGSYSYDPSLSAVL